MSDAVLEAREVHKNFRQGPVVLEVLQGVMLAVAPAERVAIGSDCIESRSTRRTSEMSV